MPFSSDMARQIISGLRSHNWPKQNSAILSITRTKIETFNKDDLFVLGRNIYQSACGTAHGAIAYLENLQIRLVDLENSVSFHVLNGVLFEIYFDSKGRFRNDPKSREIDLVFMVEESELFKESFKFIGQALRPYLKSIFYVPSSARSLSVDVSCVDYEDKMKAVDGIYFEGDNVLYDELGENYFELSDSSPLQKMDRSEMKKYLSMAMAVPSYRFKLNFVNVDDELDEFLVQIGMKVKRLSN